MALGDEGGWSPRFKTSTTMRCMTRGKQLFCDLENSSRKLGPFELVVVLVQLWKHAEDSHYKQSTRREPRRHQRPWCGTSSRRHEGRQSTTDLGQDKDTGSGRAKYQRCPWGGLMKGIKEVIERRSDNHCLPRAAGLMDGASNRASNERGACSPHSRHGKGESWYLCPTDRVSPRVQDSWCPLLER